jgi:hypothetical protein
MTACAYDKQALLWEPETSAALWAEALDTTQYRIPICGPVEVRLTQDKLDPGRVTQYMGDGTEWVPGPMGGTITFDVWLTGHGSTTEGATGTTDLWRLLGWMIGATQVSASSGDTITGGTASVPTTTGANGFDNCSLARIGTLGDTRGNGQFAAVATHAANTLTLLTAIDGAPSNGDKLYSAELAYAAETTCDIIGGRFKLLTADNQYLARGCFPMSIEFPDLDTGVLPRARCTVGVSWWKPISETWPNTTAGDTFSPGNITGGSFFFQTQGTATRVKLEVRKFSVQHALNTKPFPGPGGVNPNQVIVGAKRLSGTTRVSAVVDANGASTAPTHWQNHDNGGKWHGLRTFSPGVGSALAMRFPCLRYIGQRPTQVNNDGRNGVAIDFQALTGPTTTDELTLSRFVMAGS